MRRASLLSILPLSVVLVAPAIGADPIGPAIGDDAPTFDVDDITGPHKGEELCYV